MGNVLMCDYTFLRCRRVRRTCERKKCLEGEDEEEEEEVIKKE
jgi:hypothetical protein